MLPKEKKKPVKLSPETKLEVLRQREQGVSINELCIKYNVSLTTIYHIARERSKLQEAVLQEKKDESSRREKLVTKMENKLYDWILKMWKQRKIIFNNAIRQRAYEIYRRLLNEKFDASDEWYEQFEKKYLANLERDLSDQSVQAGEGTSSNNASMVDNPPQKLIAEFIKNLSCTIPDVPIISMAASITEPTPASTKNIASICSNNLPEQKTQVKYPHLRDLLKKPVEPMSKEQKILIHPSNIAVNKDKINKRTGQKTLTNTGTKPDFMLPRIEFPTSHIVPELRNSCWPDIFTIPERFVKHNTIPRTEPLMDGQKKLKFVVELWPEFKTEIVEEEEEEERQKLSDQGGWITEKIDWDWDDDVSTFVANVRMRLRSFDHEQQLIARRLILDILLMAERKQLQPITTIMNL